MTDRRAATRPGTPGRPKTTTQQKTHKRRRRGRTKTPRREKTIPRAPTREKPNGTGRRRTSRGTTTTRQGQTRKATSTRPPGVAVDKVWSTGTSEASTKTGAARDRP